MTSLLLGAMPAAWASTPPVAPTPSWQTNGTVYAVAYAGNTVYVGGSFTSVRPPGTNGSSVARNNVAAFSVSTDQLLSWNPNADGAVRSIAVGPTGTVYLAGAFTHVQGLGRQRAAAVDPVTGVPTAWKATIDSMVRVITLSGDGSTVYVGGNFATVNGVSKLHTAALTPDTGALASSWHADMTGTSFPNVTTIVVSGNTVYIGGSFTAVNGISRTNTVAVDAVSSSVLAWKPSTPYTILGIATAASTVYIVGRGPGGFCGAFTADVGTRLWSCTTNGDNQAVALRGTELYVGGHFTQVGSPIRHHLAAFNASTGALLPWNPDVNDDLGIEAIATSSAQIAVGGSFTAISGVSQQNFAEFNG